jgi:RteC protein
MLEIIPIMRKPFDGLYASLEKSLNDLDRRLTGADRYSQGIGLIRATIGELPAVSRKFITGRETEVIYHREVWPWFYGKWLLYIWQYRFELDRLAVESAAIPELIRREERKAAAFFRSHREFWMYYKSGSQVLDDHFTKTYTQSRVLDPLVLALDQGSATIGSYRAAWGLAMEAYRNWLAEERLRTLLIVFPVENKDYTWGTSDADFVEWLYGVQAAGAVLYKGKPADISHLVAWAGVVLQKEVVNIYDRFKIIRSRKNERTPFFKRMMVLLEKRMDMTDRR